VFLMTVAAIWTVAAVTPGANFFVVVRCALTGSRRVIVAAVLGTIAGTLCWGLAGWLGIGILFAAAPTAYLAFKIMGGLYLLWLGLKLLWSVRAPRREDSLDTDHDGLSPARAWRLSLFTNLPNPKSPVFVTSLFAATLPPDAPWTAGAAAVLLMVAISALWYSLVSLALNQGPVLRGYRKARRVIDAVAGTIFAGFGARLLFSER